MDKAEQAELERYRSWLPINKHKLDDELEQHASIQERISAKVTEMEAGAAVLKDELAKTEARLTEDFREQEKSTKDTVEAKVRRHRDRVAAWERYQGAVSDAALWSGLLDAWKVRGKNIQALGHLFGDNYFSLTTVSVGSSERELRRSIEQSINRLRPTREGRPDYGRREREPLE